MAINSVVSDWRGWSTKQDQNFTTAIEKYIVAFDDQDAPAARQLLALNAVDPVTGVMVPPGFSGHSFNPWLYLQYKNALPLGPLVFEVECTYTNQGQRSSDSAPEMFANPCDQPWDIEWGKQETSEKIDMAYDDDGNYTKRLCNANGEPFDPPLQENTVFTTLRIVKNQISWDDKLMAQYGNVINTDYFWGYKPGSVLCLGPTARRMRHANLFYFQAMFEFMFSPHDWGWKKRILNEGYQEAVVINLTTGEKELRRACVDTVETNPSKTFDEPTPLPVPLYEDGTRIYTRGEPGVPLLFQTRRKMAFAPLGVNRE